MRFASPRVIRGNRGDLLSRFGILSAMQQLGVKEITVFCHQEQDIEPLPYPTEKYGALYNLFPTRRGYLALRNCDAILWTAGLDLQDDSSLMKLLHTLLLFLSYRVLGLRIYVLMQGAGPLTTHWGKVLTRSILSQVELFVARDSRTLHLLNQINNKTPLLLGYDGIFLGDFSVAPPAHEMPYIQSLLAGQAGQPVIGFNIRQWFHFTSSILPYQFAQKRYANRSKEKMAAFIASCECTLRALRQQYDARILLLSMYQPDIEPWEDDLPYLQTIKTKFAHDDKIILVNQPLTLPGFCHLIANLDLMVGTRLHSTLTAIRLGVPAINISYTLKGAAIFADLGLSANVVNLEDYLKDIQLLLDLIDIQLHNPESRPKAQEAAARAQAQNEQILARFIQIMEKGG